MKIDKVEEKYINLDDVIIVTCPVHGDFTVVAGDHLEGVGCPDCLLEDIQDSADHIAESMLDLQVMIDQIGCILATPKERVIIQSGDYKLKTKGSTGEVKTLIDPLEAKAELAEWLEKELI